jgi:hypothetical protein
MSKINYPESSGLCSIVKDSLNDSSKFLKEANDYCSFSIPNGFKYTNYLKKLSDTISDYDTRISSIYTKCSEIDSGFNSINDTMSTYNNSLDLNIIDERDRLVKYN